VFIDFLIERLGSAPWRMGVTQRYGAAETIACAA
jgi:hypothetical protein